MPSVAAEKLKASEWQFPKSRYGRLGFGVLLALYWLYIPLTFKTDTLLLKWSFVGLWTISGSILAARWLWQRRHSIEDTRRRSWSDFQFHWRFAGFVVIWTGFLLGLDISSPNGQWSALRLLLALLLLGSLIWLIQSWRQRRPQGP